MCLLSAFIVGHVDIPSWIPKEHSKHQEFFGNQKPTAKIRSRVLESGERAWRNMRVKVDWTAADAFAQSNPSVKTKLDYMKRMIGTVKNYINDRLQANTHNTLSYKGLNSCHGVSVPNEYKSETETDLLILIRPFNESSGWFAAAGACALDSETKRPVAGAIYLNFKHIQISEMNDYFLPPIFIHETFHILGFADYFMKDLTKTIKFGNSNHSAIVSPKVVAHAKEYFGCDSIEGVPLENGGGQGSRGSHWEKTLFPSEIMNPQVASPMTISKFTIALLEDLGWYKGVNAEQLYTYLKGDGCGAIKNLECKGTSDEYCSAQEFNHDHCYPNRLGKGHCGKSSTFMGSCGYVRPTSNALCIKETDSNQKNFTFESYGAHSRCFMAEKGANNYDAACLRSRCKNNHVEIQFGNEVFTCPSAGNHQVNLAAFNGKVNCPAYSEICEELLEERCPMDCYGQGFCMSDRTCQCISGFTGHDCNDGLEDDVDPFVTSFEQGKEKKPEEEEEPEKKPEDDEENEDEKDEEEDEKEEEEEDNENDPTDEDEEVMPPQATALLEKIRKIKSKQELRLMVSNEMIMFHISRVDLVISLKGETKRITNYKAKLEKRSQAIHTAIDNVHQTLHELEQDLNGYLSVKQLQQVAQEILKMEEDLQASIISNTVAKIQYWSDRYGSRMASYQARIDKINARKAKCKSTWCKSRYDSRVAKLEKYVEFNKKLQEFCLAQKEERNNELKERIGQVKTFNGIDDIKKGMNKEINVQNKMFQ